QIPNRKLTIASIDLYRVPDTGVEQRQRRRERTDRPRNIERSALAAFWFEPTDFTEPGQPGRLGFLCDRSGRKETGSVGQSARPRTPPHQTGDARAHEIAERAVMVETHTARKRQPPG